MLNNSSSCSSPAGICAFAVQYCKYATTVKWMSCPQCLYWAMDMIYSKIGGEMWDINFFLFRRVCVGRAFGSVWDNKRRAEYGICVSESRVDVLQLTIRTRRSDCQSPIKVNSHYWYFFFSHPDLNATSPLTTYLNLLKRFMESCKPDNGPVEDLSLNALGIKNEHVAEMAAGMLEHWHLLLHYLMVLLNTGHPWHSVELH